MSKKDQKNLEFEVTDQLKTRATELVDESQEMQLAEGLRLSSAVTSVFTREQERIARKYGKNDVRTQEMKLRIAATQEARVVLRTRYVEVTTPMTEPGNGWAVDGFVKTPDGAPVSGITVAAYDEEDRWLEQFGFGCSDKNGYFSILVKKLTERRVTVFMRPSKRGKLLDSNEVQLVPTSKTANRIEIIIGGREEDDDCVPPGEIKGLRMPPEKPVDPSKDRNEEAPADKEIVVDSETARKRRLEEERLRAEEKKNADEEARKKALKEERLNKEEEKKNADEEARKKALEEERLIEEEKSAKEEARKRAHEEERLKEKEEEKKNAREEARKKSLEEERRKREEEKNSEEERKRKREEIRREALEEARKKMRRNQ